MSEDKAMSRDEMVVGSYVCSMHMNGMEGEVVRVELDERGPEYDILHVKMNDWALPQRCQRVVMMLAERPDAEPASEPASDEVAHDRAYEIERQKHEIAHIESREREALAEAAAQRERADVWQAAAQNALDQLARWRKQAIEEAARCKAIAAAFHDEGRLRYADQSRLTGLLDGMDRAKGISAEEGARVAKLEIVNHKGERRVMQLLASTCLLHHEPTEHYPRRTLKVTGYDIDRAAMRTVEIAQLRDEEEA